MRETDIRFAKTAFLRRRITLCNKAIIGARTNPNGLARMTLEGIDHELALIRRELERRRITAASNVIHLHDICIDCDGGGIYPSGAPCKSCGGTGRVNRGDGIPLDGTSAFAPAVGGPAPEKER